jgi:hypothetical protein
VLYCLVSDAQTVAGYADFEDWACDMGYDSDSREAEETFDACCKTHRALSAFLDLDALSELYTDY